eukprot:880821-Ditylum_brightwellii.AAC.1
MGAVARFINKNCVQQRQNTAHCSGQMDGSHNAMRSFMGQQKRFIHKLEQWTKHEDKALSNHTMQSPSQT